MPIYEYRDCTGQVHEEFYASWSDAPQAMEYVEGCLAVRIPSRPAPAVVVDDARKEIREKAKRGVVPLESGMLKDFERAKIEKTEQADERRRRYITEMLAPA